MSLKVMGEAVSDILEHPKMRLDLAARKLIIDKTVIILRNKEFTLLEYFLKNVGKVLTRSRILEDVWDRNICCSTNTIDVHVSVLRRKFKKHLNDGLIKTVHCVGYVLD